MVPSHQEEVSCAVTSFPTEARTALMWFYLKAARCVRLQRNDSNTRRHRRHFRETNAWKSQTKKHPLKREEVVRRTFRWTVKTRLIPAAQTSRKILNFFRKCNKKKVFIGKTALMKKELKTKNKKTQKQKWGSPSIYAAGVYFYRRSVRQNGIVGRFRRSCPRCLSALHYLHLPILPVMTILIEFKNWIITH